MGLKIVLNIIKDWKNIQICNLIWNYLGFTDLKIFLRDFQRFQRILKDFKNFKNFSED